MKHCSFFSIPPTLGLYSSLESCHTLHSDSLCSPDLPSQQRSVAAPLIYAGRHRLSVAIIGLFRYGYPHHYQGLLRGDWWCGHIQRISSPPPPPSLLLPVTPSTLAVLFENKI